MKWSNAFSLIWSMVLMCVCPFDLVILSITSYTFYFLFDLLNFCCCCCCLIARFFLDKMWFDWLILQSIHFFFLAIKWHYHLIDGIFFLFLFWSMWIEYMWFIFHHLMEWTFLILIDLIKSLYFIFIKSVLIPLIDHIFFTSCFFLLLRLC